MKYYAVSCGRTTGIFSTWTECERQVKNFSGANYKSFKSMADASAWMKNPGEGSIPVQKTIRKYEIKRVPLPVTFSETADTIPVYTDGSYVDGIFSYGAYLNWKGINYVMSDSYDLLALRNMGIPTCENMNSPTAELLGAYNALHTLNQVLKKKDSHFIKKIVFYVDYIGIISWMNGSWKAKKLHIITLVNWIRDEVQRAEPVVIFFEKVPAHSGVHGNEEADRLAGCGIKQNTFIELETCL